MRLNEIKRADETWNRRRCVWTNGVTYSRMGLTGEGGLIRRTEAVSIWVDICRKPRNEVEGELRRCEGKVRG